MILLNYLCIIPLVAFFICLVLSFQTKPDLTKRILTSQGYSHVVITGVNWFSCSGSDIWKTGFKAVSPSGTEVEGTVCTGILKESTVRLK